MDDHDIQLPQEELPEFTLEDILKEFGSQNDDGKVHEYLAPELLEDIPQQEFLEDVPVAEHLPVREEPEILIWEPAAKAEPSAPVGGDTVRVDTARIKAQAEKIAISDDTQPFTPVGEVPPQMPEPFRANPIPEGAEPFSAGWEPEYDQPIGEYVPPEPIIFRPRNRLGELKRKLMEGPEKRY